jgi:hypothetical protein
VQLPASSPVVPPRITIRGTCISSKAVVLCVVIPSVFARIQYSRETFFKAAPTSRQGALVCPVSRHCARCACETSCSLFFLLPVSNGDMIVVHTTMWWIMVGMRWLGLHVRSRRLKLGAYIRSRPCISSSFPRISQTLRFKEGNLRSSSVRVLTAQVTMWISRSLHSFP